MLLARRGLLRDARALRLFERLNDAHDLAALDLARRGARKFVVGEVERLDALVEGERRRDFAEVVLDAALNFVAAQGYVRVVVGHDEARDLLADAVGQAD